MAQPDIVTTEFLRFQEIWKDTPEEFDIKLDPQRCREIMEHQAGLVSEARIKAYDKQFQVDVPKHKITPELPPRKMGDRFLRDEEAEFRIAIAKWIINDIVPAAWNFGVAIPVAPEIIDIAKQYQGRFEGWDIPEMPEHLKNPPPPAPPQAEQPPPGGWRRRESDRRDDDEQNRGSGGASIA